MNININMNFEEEKLAEVSDDDLLEGLDPEQYKAVTYDINKNLLCNAIAGSGKTHVLTTRVAYLISKGVKPSSILLLTFTNKAAKEMLERVSEKFNNKPIAVKAGTFHSIAARYLRKYSLKIGFDKNFTILDQAESRELISQIRTNYLDNMHYEDKEAEKNYKKQFMKAQTIQNLYSNMINLNYDTSSEYRKASLLQALLDFGLDAEQYEEIQDILDEYNRLKIESESMDFDDLLIYFNLVLDDDSVRAKIQEEISHVLVDEYQDINYLQDDIIKKISNMENTFAVGDPSQSIYAFRGSDIKFIENFTKEYRCEEINLRNNYRSDKNILQLAENAINKNPQKKPVEMQAYKDTDYTQNYNEFLSIDEEIAAIVFKIQGLIKEGVDKKEIAILLRSTGRESFALEAAIRKAKIPYDLRAGFSYFNKAHIKDVVALLTLLVNSKCLVSFQRSVSLLSGVGPKTANKLYDFYKSNNFSFEDSIDDIDNLKVSKKVKTQFNQLLEVLKNAKNKEAVKDTITTITKGYYLDYLKQRYGSDDNYSERLEDVLNLTTLVDAITLSDFLEDISLDTDKFKEGEDDDRIVISTMHRSKGLEWDYVFIPFLYIGNFPKKISDDESLQEERRLFYVSLTRGRKVLFLSKAKYDQSFNTLPQSIFIRDMLEN